MHSAARRRVRLGSIEVDLVDLDGAIDVIRGIIAGGGPAGTVVTANIQHFAELRRSAEFRAACFEAALVLPDGWPVAAALSVRAGRRAARVAGADLLPALCAAAELAGWSVGLVGGSPGAAAAAAGKLRDAHPALKISLVEEAPLGFLDSAAALDVVLERVSAAQPDLLFLAFGTPKQELFAHRYRHRLGARVVVGVGQSIDLIAGFSRRAPRVWRRIGLEWFYRLVREPARLMPRYARSAPVFLLELLRPAAARKRR